MSKKLISTIALSAALTLGVVATVETTIAQPVSAKSTSNKKYKSIVKSINKQFNKDGKAVTVKVKNGIVDSDQPKKHSVVEVTIKSADLKKNVKAAQSAIDEGNATSDQQTLIYGIQQVISDEAKKLKNNKDVVSFGYKLSADNNRPIARSSKTKDIIPLVDVNAQ